MTLLSRFRGARVGFLHDVFRFHVEPGRAVNLQQRNVAWLASLLGGRQAFARHRWEVAFLRLPHEPAALRDQLAADALWERYLHDPTGAWASTYEAQTVPGFHEALAAVVQRDLVIAFEASPAMRRFLHAQGVAYVNFFIHPVRFLRDLCLGATTNREPIATLLRECRIDPFQIDAQASRFAARYRRRIDASVELDPALPLLVGQVEHDASLLAQGRFARWNDHDLGPVLAGARAVAFLEHPYRPNSAEVLEWLRCGLGLDVLSSRSGGYPLLFAATGPRRVVTLSSSLGVEAQALGHEVTFLLGNPLQRAAVPGVDLGEVQMLGHRILMPKADGREDDFALGDGYLRGSLEAWSYARLAAQADEPAMRWTFRPARSGSVPEVLFSADEAGEAPCAPEVACDGPPAGRAGPRTWQPGTPGFDELLLAGFHAPEHWGVWSRHTRAVLQLPVDAGPLEVVLELQAFEGLLPQAPVLAVVAGGALRGLVFFRSRLGARQELRFTLDWAGGPLRIEFELPQQSSPLEAGLSGDSRKLAFAVLKATATPVPEAAPALAAAHRVALCGL